MSRWLPPVLAADQPVPDQGLTSEVHRAHVGEIVFATSVIEKWHEDSKTFQTHFRTGDGIYGRFYLARSLTNESIHRFEEWEDGHYELRILVDGKRRSSFRGQLDRDETTLELGLVRPLSDHGEWEMQDWYEREITRHMPPGHHEIRVELWPERNGKPYGDAPLARGTFTLD